ncbi:MAG: hypothetical protein LLG05_10570 [Porphyromonadaceae bacterium]|nr:hypothetical protein [Porphyromonadaceae bacterium]
MGQDQMPDSRNTIPSGRDRGKQDPYANKDLPEIQMPVYQCQNAILGEQPIRIFLILYGKRDSNGSWWVSTPDYLLSRPLNVTR